ncbi:hypothetical protein MLD38_036341 [Melastoma candidum]|uniref:Uncharacterized protein n=1 Tax=Melastoma candidum TaxID=119954 RepID=A0ACB9LJC6_9MYRT|nr:hypothetical protein MLD38_036341 [Melastoma candidum]
MFARSCKESPWQGMLEKVAYMTPKREKKADVCSLPLKGFWQGSVLAALESRFMAWSAADFRAWGCFWGCKQPSDLECLQVWESESHASARRDAVMFDLCFSFARLLSSMNPNGIDIM